MADYSCYTDDGALPETGESRAGAAFSAIMNWAGAGVSLALIAGLGVWGWHLVQRDVSGVPVVRALEGPMRIAPENPGGTVADHQGLAVNRIPAVGEADAGPDRVVLAPPPSDLTGEDQPMASLLPDDSGAPVEVEAGGAPQGEPLSAIDLAVAEALGGIEPGLEVTPVAFTGDSIEAAPAVAGGLTLSPRPNPRPSRTVRAPAVPLGEPAPAPVAGLEAIDLDPASVETGARLVQLGAFPSPEEARAEWDRVAADYSDYMNDKRRVVQQAETGGTTFYRLRAAGFDDLNDARRFCAVLLAGDAGCIPVVQR